MRRRRDGVGNPRVGHAAGDVECRRPTECGVEFVGGPGLSNLTGPLEQGQITPSPMRLGHEAREMEFSARCQVLEQGVHDGPQVFGKGA